jgi:hypothetical protein
MARLMWVMIGGLGGAALSENKELVWSVWLFASSRFVRPHAFDLALDCVFSGVCSRFVDFA